MKTLAKFVVLLVVLAFCLPADGQEANGNILIFTKTMKCFGAEGNRVVDSPDWNWDAGDERVTGYLILEVVYDENGEIDYINDAEQVEYWREGRERWYEQFDELFDVERIEIEDRWGRPIVYWVLESWNTWDDEGEEGIWFIMLRGKARMTNIGLGWAAEEKREVASMLEGCCQEWDWSEILGEPSVEYIDKWMCCETLRLHPWWTRLANAYWEAYEEAEGEGFDYDPFEFAVGGVDDDEPYGIVKAWLEWLGYEEIR